MSQQSVDIEFAPWETPFANGELTIMRVDYGHNNIYVLDNIRKLQISYPKQIKPCIEDALKIRICNVSDFLIYDIHFEFIFAYRVADEMDFAELWDATNRLGKRPALATFMAKNSAWSRKTVSGFHLKNWSYVIATGDDCIEIISQTTPTYRKIGVAHTSPLEEQL